MRATTRASCVPPLTRARCHRGQAFVAAAEHFGYEFAERDMDAGIVRLREKRGGGDDLVHEVRGDRDLGRLMRDRPLITA